MFYRKFNVVVQGMFDVYKSLFDVCGYFVDVVQLVVVGVLQNFYGNLFFFKVDCSSIFKCLLMLLKLLKGVYFWGGVGCGKSFLMDCFYDFVFYCWKWCIYFYVFMQQIYCDLE